MQNMITVIKKTSAYSVFAVLYDLCDN